ATEPYRCPFTAQLFDRSHIQLGDALLLGVVFSEPLRAFVDRLLAQSKEQGGHSADACGDRQRGTDGFQPELCFLRRTRWQTAEVTGEPPQAECGKTECRDRYDDGYRNPRHGFQRSTIRSFPVSSAAKRRERCCHGPSLG